MNSGIHPMLGLGDLRFGMTPEEARNFTTPFGPSEQPVHGPLAFSPEEIDEYRNLLGEEGLAALLGATAHQNAVDNRLRDIFYPQVTMRLTYDEGRLFAIQVSRLMNELHFQGLRFFHSDTRAFLAALDRANRAPALVLGPDCAFRKINIYVWAAFEIFDGGAYRIYLEDDEDAQDKSLILSSQARDPLEDFSRHTAISFQ